MKSYRLLLCLVCCAASLTVNAMTAAAKEPIMSSREVSPGFLNAGLDWRKEVEDDQRKLDGAFEKLDRAIALISNENLSGERLTILQLRRVVKQMRNQAQKVIAAHESTLAATAEYDESIREAAPLMLKAARQFKTYAAHEPYEELQEDYRLWGETFEAIARKYQQQQVAVPPTITALSENLAFVIRTELQLARIEELLDIVPEEGVGTEEFLTRLAAYVEAFGKFRRRLRTLHQRAVGEESDLTLPAATTVDETKKDKTASNQPLTKGNAEQPVETQPIPSQLVRPLVGRWEMGKNQNRIQLEVYLESEVLHLRLADRHEILSEVEGKVVPDGSQLAVQDLVYTLRTGERLTLGNCPLERFSDNELALHCPMIRGTSVHDARVTSDYQSYPLHRVL